jgi:hypothetical protein
MNVSESRRSTKWAPFAAMLLAVGLVAAPETAWAGCNHAASSQSVRRDKLHGLDDLILHGAFSALRGANEQSPPGSPARTPCSGPSCSNRPVPLPISTLPVSPESRDRWGTVGVTIIVDNSSFHHRMVDEPSSAAGGEKSSIFHPPRV